jgi:hypothetical protein
MFRDEIPDEDEALDQWRANQEAMFYFDMMHIGILIKEFGVEYVINRLRDDDRPTFDILNNHFKWLNAN